MTKDRRPSDSIAASELPAIAGVPATAGVTELRRALRSVLALYDPPIESPGDPALAADALLAVLIDKLELQSAYVRMPVPHHGTELIVARTAAERCSGEAANILGERLRRHVVVATDRRRTPRARRSVPGAVALIPLGKTAQSGELLVEGRDDEFPTEADSAILSVAALHLHSVVDAWQMHRELKEAQEKIERREREMTLLTDLSIALSQAATTEELARAVIAHAKRAFGADAGMVARVREDEKSIEILHGEGAWAIDPDQKILPLDDRNPAADVVRSGQGLFLERRDEWVRRWPESLAARHGMESLLVKPLIVNDRAIGVMAIGFTRPHAFSGDERTFSVLITRQAAQALDRARLFDSERNARTEAERANRTKTDFLATMSHEIRTPLNAIAGYVELFDLGIAGDPTPQQREYLGRIQRSQRYLLTLIDDLLNFTKIDAGRVETHVEMVDLTTLVHDLDSIIAPQMRGKRLRYELQPCDQDVVALTDAAKVRQIILNLISNSVKFTPVGGTVRLSCAATDGMIRIRVRDSGSGIDPRDLDRIFEPFVQLDRGQDGFQRGVGLGLAISRDLARALGGDVVAESTVGAGSTFELRLPRHQPGGPGAR